MAGGRLAHVEDWRDVVDMRLTPAGLEVDVTTAGGIAKTVRVPVPEARSMLGQMADTVGG